MNRSIRLAGCVIKDDQDRILLLHRNTSRLRQWEIPGGKLDPGEDEQTTAIRELQEEMGIEVNLERQLGRRSFVEDGRTMEYTWFLATIASGTPEVRERNLHDDWAFHTIEDLSTMVEELSPNVKNLVEEIARRRIRL